MIKGFFHTSEIGDIHKDILPYLNVGLTSDEKSLELGDDLLNVTDYEGTEERIQFKRLEGLGFFVNDSLIQDFL